MAECIANSELDSFQLSFCITALVKLFCIMTDPALSKKFGSGSEFRSLE
jgi:hypothetical protein